MIKKCFNFAKKKIGKAIIFILLMICTVSFIYPLYFMAINSLKSRTEYYVNPFGVPQGSLQFVNYLTMISQFKILNLFKNTFVVCVVSLVFLLVFGICASYAFAKLKFKGINLVYVGIVITIFVPAQVVILPLYAVFSKMHLINNYLSLILAYLAGFLPEVILLLTSNFRSIPTEMIEASEIDGCSYFKVVRYVVAPMGRSAIILTIIFYFVIMWNDLFTPMILIQKMDNRTVMVALASLVQRYNGDPPFKFAGLMLSTVPTLIVYSIFQRHIIKGISVGAIK